MKILVFTAAALLLFAHISSYADNKVFPYKYSIDVLPNGLCVVTIPTDYPGLVASYIVVQTGSRNEVEPGKSGFAHLFEHLMFRGTDKFPTAKYEEILKSIGADSNAYTTDDRTVYHTVFMKEDLDQVMLLEADRFQHNKYGIDLFKTETKAVLGEYNKNFANPTRKLYEVARDTAFQTHTYKHTTMGFIKDIENMPNMYDYSLQFFDRYYRPEYTTIIIAGDVKSGQVLPIVKKYWGDWKRGSYVPRIPVEPNQTRELTAQIDWPTETLPWVMVNYKGPAYSDEAKDKPALDLIASIGFSESSDLYQKLVINEQKVDTLYYDFEDKADPYLVAVEARVKDPKDIEYVRNEIISAFDSFKNTPPPREKLEAVKSNIRYSFALSMNNSEAIATNIAPYIALRRTPETINKLFAVYASITPEDIQAMANRYFTANHRTVVTLSHKEK